MIQLTDYVGTLFDNTSNPNKLTVALTMAVKALEKGHSAALILMIDAVHLAKPNAFDTVNIGAPFKPAAELLNAFLEKQGKIYVCKSCLVHNQIDPASINPQFEVITADDVIDLMMHAKGTLQVA